MVLFFWVLEMSDDNYRILPNEDLELLLCDMYGLSLFVFERPLIFLREDLGDAFMWMIDDRYKAIMKDLEERNRIIEKIGEIAISIGGIVSSLSEALQEAEKNN